jgi:hypothetical protein
MVEQDDISVVLLLLILIDFDLLCLTPLSAIFQRGVSEEKIKI